MAGPLRFLLLLLTILGAGVPLTAQVSTVEPSALLGLGPESVYRDLGAPAEIFPVAVDSSRWQVAQFYPQFLTLYWYSNHVWQVRVDRRYQQPFFGLTMGEPREQVLSQLGTPQAGSADGVTPVWAAWPLPFQGFPRVVRLVFENNLLVDASFYRSDL